MPQHRGRIQVSHWEGGAALRVGQFGHFLRFSAYEPEQKVTLWAPPGRIQNLHGFPPSTHYRARGVGYLSRDKKMMLLTDQSKTD